MAKKKVNKKGKVKKAVKAATKKAAVKSAKKSVKSKPKQKPSKTKKVKPVKVKKAKVKPTSAKALVGKNVAKSVKPKTKKVVKVVPKAKVVTLPAGKAGKKIEKPVKSVKPLKVKELPKVKVEKTKEVVVVPAALPPAKARRGRAPKPFVPKIIKTNVIMPKLVEEMAIQKTKKEPAGKFQLEFVVHASPSLLFEFFSTPPGLSEWFSDDVNIRDGVYTFYWDGQEQNAKVIGMKEEQFIRFQWVDRNDGSYFEFRVVTDELTNDVSLIITDFAETPADAETSKLLWNSQVGKLMQVLGAY